MKKNLLASAHAHEQSPAKAQPLSNRLALNFRQAFCALFLVLASFQFNAQNFAIVGTGNGSNSSTSYPAPFGHWYEGARHQMFVTSAELLASGIQPGSLISALGFNVLNTNSGTTHQGFQVKVFTTTLTNPLQVAFIGATQVAASTPSNVAPTLGWIMLPFTGFNWNGTDNLVIETCFYTANYTQNFSTEWQSNLTGTEIKTRWINQDLNPNICTSNGNSTSSTTRPLIRFEWVPGVPCTGTPMANTVVVTPTSAICPNSSAGLTMANSYTVGGMTYQWQYSNVSAVGPWTTIPSATLSGITSPTLNANHYFSAIVTCTNSNLSITTAAGTVQVQNTTTNTVPYFEGFEGIDGPMKLPNCSWSQSNANLTTLTYTSVQTANRSPRTGNSFASFYYSPSGSNIFWTNQIWMEAGVTYSANVWYKTEGVGYLTWQMNLHLNSGQTVTGSTVIATTGGPGSAVSATYKLLSNTFTVGTTGFYNVGIQGVSNGVCCANYMSWDDLEIMIPCQLNPVTVSVNSNTQSICQGSSVNLTATGADTYVWSTGSTNANIVESPMFPTTYNVVGTNAITNCTASAVQHIVVNPAPLVSAVSFDPEICQGESTTLQAFGADTYAWSNSTNGAMTSVSPNATTSYTVTGTNSFGCSANAAITITVHTLPSINVISTALGDVACSDDVTTLTGSGTNVTSYQWVSANSLLIGNPVNVSPNSSTTYTVIGTDVNGCEGEFVYTLSITECVGLKDVSTTSSGIKLYPNPNKGEFVVEVHNKKINALEVTDLTGRVLINTSSANEKISVDMSQFANGVYYVKISSENNSEVIKVVKQ